MSGTLCLNTNYTIDEVKKKYPNYQYAVVMRNNFKNGTDGKTRWLSKDLETAKDDCFGNCMAENHSYIYDLWNNEEIHMTDSEMKIRMRRYGIIS